MNPESNPETNRGKVVILAMVMVGLCLSGYAWWNRWNRSQQVLEYFGREAAIAIRTGPQVQLLKLVPKNGDDGPSLAIRGQNYHFQAIDISHAPGLIHARHHLLHEKGYHWEELPVANQPADWTLAIRFSNDLTGVTIAFDFVAQKSRLLERDVEANMGPISAALEEFFGEIIRNDDAGLPISADNQ